LQYIAHIRKKDKKIQTLAEHLKETQRLAEIYGEKIGIGHITGLAGALHDVGKYSNAFQQYIREVTDSREDIPYIKKQQKSKKVDHSTAGGKLLYDHYHCEPIDMQKGLLAEIVGNAIISHHNTLQDFVNSELSSDYLKRVNKKEIEDYVLVKNLFLEEVMSEFELDHYVTLATDELTLFIEKNKGSAEKSLAFLVKYVYSALLDADRTGTRCFEEECNAFKEIRSEKEVRDIFETYYQRLTVHLDELKHSETATHPINLLRSKLSEKCDNYAEKPSGIYTLSIPTGGGKTLASLRYALRHSLEHNKERIIYVLPYITITEQNAHEVQRILCDDVNIIEHHSNIILDSKDEKNDKGDEDDEDEDGRIEKNYHIKLSRDNWDAPIIFTTMVQFLNVFYDKKNRNTRRLHRLSNAVIIFDEVQKVPIKCVHLFNEALNFLKHNCESSILLCTATQPALDYVKNRLEINADGEMVDQLDKIQKEFKRVNIISDIKHHCYTTRTLARFITEKACEVSSILIILNTKSVVRNLYQVLKLEFSDSDVKIYHLSTAMCAEHRRVILEEVRERLNFHKPVICISTPLIEAGVDISFECVIRSVTGLDSIAQAAGRCNRHGEKSLQNVYVIAHEEEKLDMMSEIKKGKEIAMMIFRDLELNPKSYGGSILSQNAMVHYFKLFYDTFKTDLDYPIFAHGQSADMINVLFENKKDHIYYNHLVHNGGENGSKGKLPLFLLSSYKSASEQFKIIDNPTTEVIVPFREGGEKVVEMFTSGDMVVDISKMIQRAQQYSIGLYQHEKDALTSMGLISYHCENQILILNERAYDDDFGLNLEGTSEMSLQYF